MALMYPTVGYPGITPWAGVVPESTWAPISYLIEYPGSMLPGYGRPTRVAFGNKILFISFTSFHVNITIAA